MMKNISLVLLMITLISCSKSSTDPTPVTSFTVQINGGVGSGTYKPDDAVFIFSDAAASSQVFDKWTGDVSQLQNFNEWRTSVKTLASNLTVTATYKTITPITFTNLIINSSQVYYHVPSTYKGVIILFHGTGGSAKGWTAASSENLEFSKYAAASGYALVVTESKDRTNKLWSTTPTGNVDIANIDIILSTLQTNGVIAASKPLYGLGMSQGGGFCSLISALKNYKAAALYCVPGLDQVFTQSTVPTIWNLASKDVTQEPSRNTNAKANYDKLVGRGIAASYNVNDPSPLYASRFTFLINVNTTASTEIYNSLKNAGYIDAKGFFTLDPEVNTAWQSALPVAYQTAAYVPDLEDQLYVAYTQHKFFKDANFRTIDFFNQH
jgi:hypothetical protein